MRRTGTKGISLLLALVMSIVAVFGVPGDQPSSARETMVDSYRVPLQSLDFSIVGEKKEYTSPPVAASFIFDSLSASWRLPQGSQVSIRPWSAKGQSKEQEHSSFTLLRDDIQEDDGKRTLHADPVFTPDATAFQYRIVMPMTASFHPRDTHLAITYLKSSTSLPASTNQASAAGSIIQERSAWNADESLRTVTGWLTAREKYCEKAGCAPGLPAFRTSSEVMPDVADLYPDEAKIIRSEGRRNGQELVWPEEYVQRIKKLILHHTAENLNDAVRSSAEFSAGEFQAHIRSIYYYHAIIRGWGDIGYNYIVDPLGNVYQGRAGGDNVVGGHTSSYNQGSAGIALMGNFENGDPPQRQILATISLLSFLGKKYDIDPGGVSTLRGKSGPSVLSHRDLGQTACPGEKLYPLLSSIRQDAHKSFMKEKGGDAIVSGTTSFVGYVGQKMIVELKVKNNTTTAWQKNKIQLSVASPTRRSLLYEPGSWSSVARPGTMVESAVEPGGTATWKFNIVARKMGTITEQFKFNIPGKGYLKTDPIHIDVRVQPRIAKKPIAASATSSAPSPTPSRSPSPSPKAASAQSTPAAQPTASANPTIRIRLMYEDPKNEVALSSDQAALVSFGATSRKINANDTIAISRKTDGTLTATMGQETVTGTTIHLKPLAEGIITVKNWDRTPSWSKDGKVNYNQFRGAMRVINEGGKLKLVNSLPLEQYLSGIAESSNTEPEGMRKLMAVLSRSYALHYTDPANRKFPNAPYDGSDSPAEFQYYLGYGFEILAPNWVQSVRDTRGLVVKYAGKLVKTPYFSSSNGKTKDPQVVWGWSAPYLKPVDDSACPDKVLRGHGVGLSACGARQMIKEGKNYLDVIKYYYSGVTVEEV